MTLDLPSTLVIVGVGGYTSFRTSTYFSNSQYNSINGERLVFKSLLYGTIDVVFFLGIMQIFSVKLPANNGDVEFGRLALLIAGFVFISGLVGIVLASSLKPFMAENLSLRKDLMGDIDPAFSNYLEERLIALYNPLDPNGGDFVNRTLSFFEMKNGKIYIGLIQKFDLNDDIPINERFVILVPIYSGKRFINDKIELPTDYLTVSVDNLIRSKLLKDESVEDSKAIITQATLSIKPIVFSQSEVFSLREFDEDMAKGFGLI